ncbi:hypothetical protein [Enterocloster sp.]|uniref:hypothetical protein n=1 Tax=Enterocloster sp. TaxID=2719315 RepID=UPI0039A227B0
MGRGNYPEPEATEKIKSIIEKEPAEVSYICGRGGKLHKHHIFGGNPNREHSEQYGLTVHLCPDCHTEGKDAVHKDAEIWKRYTKLVKQLLSGNTRERSLCGFSEKLSDPNPDNEPDGCQREPEWGFIWLALMLKGRIAACGKITYIGPAQCIWCEKFIWTCVRVLMNQECDCQTGYRESIGVQLNGAHECICTINNGELV